MIAVELVYDGDCPNIEAARQALREAFAGAGLPARWQEWDRADPGSPAHVRGLGSPTILVDGRDVTGMGPADEACCRVYRDECGCLAGAPPVAAITQALRQGVSPARR